MNSNLALSYYLSSSVYLNMTLNCMTLISRGTNRGPCEEQQRQHRDRVVVACDARRLHFEEVTLPRQTNFTLTSNANVPMFLSTRLPLHSSLFLALGMLPSIMVTKPSFYTESRTRDRVLLCRYHAVIHALYVITLKLHRLQFLRRM